MKNCLLTLLAIGLLSSATAQRIHLGLNTAFAKVYLLDHGLKDDLRYAQLKSKSSALIGFSFGLETSGGNGFMMDFFFSQLANSYKMLDVNQTQIGQRSINCNYWNLPLMLRKVSDGDRVRLSYGLGVQLSFLTKGEETIQQVADSAKINISANQTPPAGAIKNADGTYTVLKFEESSNTFTKMPISVVGTLGIDIQIIDNLLLSVNSRVTYTLTDMNSDELIKGLYNNPVTAQSLEGRRAELIWVMQFAAHYIIEW